MVLIQYFINAAKKPMLEVHTVLLDVTDVDSFFKKNISMAELYKIVKGWRVC